MIVAGIDIGSRTTKTVAMDRCGIRAYSVTDSGPLTERVARESLEKTLRRARVGQCLPACVVATGYGRLSIPFATKQLSEISCHAKGAVWVFPSVRSILDIGGQDCKAMLCDAGGKIVDFVMNDKCAAGTGRFLELTAEAFHLPLEKIGPKSLTTEKSAQISSTCAVFARSEALLLAREGIPRDQILAGLHEAFADRIAGLAKRLSLVPDFMITGGIAKNVGMIPRIESRVGLKAMIPTEPQITGALGAALFALEEVGVRISHA